MNNTPGNKLRQAVKDNSPLQVVGAVTAYCAILAQKSGHKALDRKSVSEMIDKEELGQASA